MLEEPSLNEPTKVTMPERGIVDVKYDVNNDGIVSVADIVAIANIMAGN